MAASYLIKELLVDKHQIFPAFVSTADAAKLLGISENSVRNFVRRGLLPTPKHLGTRTLHEVAGLIEAVRHASAPQTEKTDPNAGARA